MNYFLLNYRPARTIFSWSISSKIMMVGMGWDRNRTNTNPKWTRKRVWHLKNKVKPTHYPKEHNCQKKKVIRDHHFLSSSNQKLHFEQAKSSSSSFLYRPRHCIPIYLQIYIVEKLGKPILCIARGTKQIERIVRSSHDFLFFL